jgi:hypothetical protein
MSRPDAVNRAERTSDERTSPLALRQVVASIASATRADHVALWLGAEDGDRVVGVAAASRATADLARHAGRTWTAACRTGQRLQGRSHAPLRFKPAQSWWFLPVPSRTGPAGIVLLYSNVSGPAPQDHRQAETWRRTTAASLRDLDVYPPLLPERSREVLPRLAGAGVLALLIPALCVLALRSGSPAAPLATVIPVDLAGQTSAPRHVVVRVPSEPPRPRAAEPEPARAAEPAPEPPPPAPAEEPPPAPVPSEEPSPPAPEPSEEPEPPAPEPSEEQAPVLAAPAPAPADPHAMHFSGTDVPAETSTSRANRTNQRDRKR